MIEALRPGLEAARSAPSAHNVQPWAFGVDEAGIVLGWRQERELPHGDPKSHYLLTGLGAAAEGYSLGLAVRGECTAIEFDWRPDLHEAATMARAPGVPDAVDIELGRVLPYRQTSRGRFRRRPIPSGGEAALAREADRLGCSLVIMSQRRVIRRAARLTGRGTAFNLADRGVFAELAELLRMDRRDPEYKRDGLTIETLATGRGQAMSRRLVLRPGVMRVLSRLGLHHLVARTQRRLALQAAALALLVAPSEDPADLFHGGRAMLRVWARATWLGLRVHPMTAAMDHASTRASLARLFGSEVEAAPIVLFRLGYGKAGARSPRLPIDEIVVRR